MTSSNEPPLTRRAARLAQQASQGADEPGDAATPLEHAAPSPANFGVSRPSADAIEYRTELRPRVPRYEPSTPQSFDAVAGPPMSAPVAPPLVPPTAPAPGHSARPRDFRPPAEHSAPPTFPAGPPEGSELDYRTQGGAVSARGVGHGDHTMTRRELRALREAQSGELPVVGRALSDAAPAPVIPPGAAGERESGSAAPAAPRPASESGGRRAALVQPEPEEPSPLHLWQPTRSGSVAPAPLIEPEPHALGDVAGPADSTATGSHWSAGFSEPADDPFENTFSRSVGSASVSTNALVLPEMPVGTLAGPVPGTGEIIITGMVEVPASIASTGAIPSVHDSPDLDELVDAGDREFVSTDSAPVSAIHAVSSHTVTRTVIAGRRPRGTVMATVLIVSTVIMAVAAVTIFVVAAANGLL